MDQSLPRQLRLRTRRDYTWLQRTGIRAANHAFTILIRYARPNEGRFGLTVSRKVGNAVARNHIKRRLRHLMRTHHRGAFLNRDLVIIVRPGTAETSFTEVEAALTDALQKADVALKQKRSRKSGKRGAGKRNQGGKDKSAQTGPPKKEAVPSPPAKAH